ncbi:hypothetical protein [Streptomyces sp. NPDC093094]|uniref:hypothetical protein n=1 Tax=Streptomyces sp. NPDC093094 TaxID=3366026 RepID=UPI0038261399
MSTTGSREHDRIAAEREPGSEASASIRAPGEEGGRSYGGVHRLSADGERWPSARASAAWEQVSRPG